MAMRSTVPFPAIRRLFSTTSTPSFFSPQSTAAATPGREQAELNTNLFVSDNMILQQSLSFQNLFPLVKDSQFQQLSSFSATNSHFKPCFVVFASFVAPLKLPKGGCFMRSRLRSSQSVKALKSTDGTSWQGYESSETHGGHGGSSDDDDDDSSQRNGAVNDPYLMDSEERLEWRRKIREVIDKYPDVEEELVAEEKKVKMQKLLSDYPLVVDEDDPDWPEDADGWGFKLGQFFNKITIKNNRKGDDDESYDDEGEIVWQDDNYIRPVKDITAAEWEDTVFKDISPLIILVHNRYKRPKENKKIREELEKAVHIIWNCRLPSPRCVAIDAVVETNLVSSLRVSVFPEVIFTKAGKILYREKAIRTADVLSKIMAYFYYGAAKPPCLNDTGDLHELIPSVVVSS